MISDITQLEMTIYEALNDLSRGLYDKNLQDGKWTPPFKNALRSLGEKHGYTVWGSFPDRSEWLFDIVWAYCVWPEFKGVALACEIEWKRSDERHREDFCKLTVADCDLRLFVFGCKPGDEDKKFDFIQELASYRSGQRYLAIAVPYTWDGDLPHRAWTS